nr:MAG TPA: hypothetical protein [Caudoviricetes sp.]
MSTLFLNIFYFFSIIDKIILLSNKKRGVV